MAEGILTVAQPRQTQDRRGNLTLRRLVAHRTGLIGAVIVCGLAVAALVAPLIAPYDPLEQASLETTAAPNLNNLLGTDYLSRDVLSRVIYGARISLSVSILSVLLGTLIGTMTGLVAGFWRGWTDRLLMRLTDALLAFPALVLALSIAAFFGASLRNVVLALAVIYAPGFARVIRSQVLLVRERDFVLAARSLGASDRRLVIRHILPSLTNLMIVQATLSIGSAMLAEASMSFLGVGVPPPAPSWGSMLKEGYPYLEIAPWLALVPGFVILIAVLGFNFLGDGLSDLLDPTTSSAE